MTSFEFNGLYLEKRTRVQGSLFTVLDYFDLDFEGILWFPFEQPNSLVGPSSSVTTQLDRKRYVRSS